MRTFLGLGSGGLRLETGGGEAWAGCMVRLLSFSAASKILDFRLSVDGAGLTSTVISLFKISSPTAGFLIGVASLSIDFLGGDFSYKKKSTKINNILH